MKAKIVVVTLSMVIGSSLSCFSQRDEHHNDERNQQPQQFQNRPEGREEQHDFIRASRRDVVFRSAPPNVITRRDLPEGYSTYHHNNRDYYYHGGSYYDYNNRRYIGVVPPVGMHVRILPEGFRQVIAAAGTFFYSAGLFYSAVNDGYQIVDPPVGALVYDLPMDAEIVTLNGQMYYHFNSTLFQRVFTDQGQAFRVVGHLDD